MSLSGFASSFLSKERIMDSKFQKAANRRFNEMLRLNEHQREQLRARQAKTEKHHENLRRQEERRQREEHGKDVAAKVIEIMRAKPHLTLDWIEVVNSIAKDPKFQLAVAKDVLRDAEKRVWRDNEQRLTGMATTAKTALEQRTELYLSRIPEFKAERESVAAQRSHFVTQRAATEVEFGRGRFDRGRGDADGGRER
jgi:hypothetical protein